MLLKDFLSATADMKMKLHLYFEVTTSNKSLLCVYDIEKTKTRVNLLVNSNSTIPAISLELFYTLCSDEQPQTPIYIYDTHANVSYPIFGYRIQEAMLLLK